MRTLVEDGPGSWASFLGSVDLVKSAELLPRRALCCRYGGESHFDNMRGFCLGNGFNAVIDRGHFKNPRFVGSWGGESLMGVEDTHPLPGRDLTRTLPKFGNSAGPPPRAMMQNEQSYARLQGDILTVLLPNGTARHFGVDRMGQRLTPLVLDDRQRHRDALASVLMPAWIYRERRYGFEYPQ